MRSLRFVCSTALIVTALAASSCRRTPSVSDAAYRDAVAAFHTSLAALQTSQDVLARRELERVVQLVPHEPAGKADTLRGRENVLPPLCHWPVPCPCVVETIPRGGR